MIKLYEVELKTHIVVAATSKEDALQKSNSTVMQRDVIRDSALEVDVQREITQLAKLPYGWDGECIPYGGDGNTRINAWYAPSISSLICRVL